MVRVSIFVLMSGVSVLLQCLLFPVGMNCLLAFIVIVVKCLVTLSIDVYSVILNFGVVLQ